MLNNLNTFINSYIGKNDENPAIYLAQIVMHFAKQLITKCLLKVQR